MHPTSYTLSQKYPHAEFLQVTIAFQNLRPDEQETLIYLPAWRPGRYQLGNFSKNIRSLRATDAELKPLSIVKKGKDSWKVKTAASKTFIVQYEVYTSVVDGGSTYVDEEIWYLNFINCMMYQQGSLEAPCHVQLEIPQEWTIATSLKLKEKRLSAPNFYALVDSPVIAAKTLQHLQYTAKEVNFHLWFHGKIEITNENQLLQDFQKFSELQLNTMQEFEGTDYHFLFQLLDQKAYHGVEHLNSTSIVLGPASEFDSDALYDNLLGISSHELFHFWNIIRIRPQEMYPYNFQEENYFTTGFVAEGVTTYYGDLFLLRSGVRSLSWYIEELNKLLKRHFENYGRQFYSLADSSMDLWVDGYELGTPNRKVSIYVKGAIIALILDLEIILNTQSNKNLDDLMRKLWSDFYKKGIGYSQAGYLKAAEEVSQLRLDQYEKDFINGTVAVEERLGQLLESFGFQLVATPHNDLISHYLGIKTLSENNQHKIIATAPDSPGERNLRIGDVLVSVDNKPIGSLKETDFKTVNMVEVSLWRKEKFYQFNVAFDKLSTYYGSFKLAQKQIVSEHEVKNRMKWLQQ